VGHDKYCSRQNYFAILKGEKEEPPINEEFTEHGKFCEPYGVAAVIVNRGCWVDSFGKEQWNFCLQDYMKENGTTVDLSCTPDGIIKDLNCLCEIKSPFYKVEEFSRYLIKGKLDKEFKTKKNSPKDFQYKGKMGLEIREEAMPC